MKIAVIGCGSIGRRHIGNLISLGLRKIRAYDIDPGRRHQTEALFGIECSPSLEALWGWGPDAALVCSPTSLHLEHCLAAARSGCHIFVEKPLSHGLQDGLKSLLKEVDQRRLVTMVGCNFKFHPSFRRMKEILEEGCCGRILSARCQFGQYLPQWRPWQDYRNTYSARASLGGGILLDAHEFDYMMWFLGEIEQVFCLKGKLSGLDIDTEDTAEVLLRFRSGAIGEMHLDYTQRYYQRNFEFFGEEGTLSWDFEKRRVALYLAKEGSWRFFDEPRDYALNQMYVDEMRHFLECIEGSQKTVTEIASGLEVLKVVVAAKRSAEEGRLIDV